MRLRSTILALAVCAIPSVVQAQPIQGFYIGAGAGLWLPFAIKSIPIEPGFGGKYDLKQRPGYDGQLSIGYALGNGWRFELEASAARSPIKSASGTPFTGATSGAIRNTGLMFNALFDLDVASPYIYPYLGLGVGYQWTHLDDFTVTRSDNTFRYTASGTASGVAVQALGGLAFPIPNMPGLSLTADYRIMDILGGEKFDGRASYGVPPGNTLLSGSTKFHNQYEQSVMIGVRYAFNTPPPASLAPPPISATPRTQSYLVFFDWDKASLSDRAQAVVKDAADASTKVQTTRIEVSGNADTSGSPLYNQRLSERRAHAVAAALVGDGVPKEAISIQAFGDTKPLVPTGPGVREPRNRRVDIVVP